MPAGNEWPCQTRPHPRSLTGDVGDEGEPHEQLHPPAVDGGQQAQQRPLAHHALRQQHAERRARPRSARPGIVRAGAAAARARSPARPFPPWPRPERWRRMRVGRASLRTGGGFLAACSPRGVRFPPSVPAEMVRS